jgi:hypothetical protein
MVIAESRMGDKWRMADLMYRGLILKPSENRSYEMNQTVEKPRTDPNRGRVLKLDIMIRNS